MSMSAKNEAPLYLGHQSALPASPDDAVIDTVRAVQVGRHGGPQGAYLVRLSCPEFTSLCPHTGQPDFAHMVIDYAPDKLLVESKALKLFLGSFRNHGAFHEQCSVEIGRRLAGTLEPFWLRVNAYWFPRGGIPIDVFWEYGELPKGVRLPAIDIPSYRAR